VPDIAEVLETNSLVFTADHIGHRLNLFGEVHLAIVAERGQDTYI